ncbi:GTPase-activating protein gyp1 [Pelomyxa schiedti]|nr:GTPase-activating protein gyp1 [Pelomyxa schiedti]
MEGVLCGCGRGSPCGDQDLLQLYVKALSSPYGVPSVDALRNLTQRGVPCRLRARVWQILLGHMDKPEGREQWYTEYRDLVGAIFSPVEGQCLGIMKRLIAHSSPSSAEKVVPPETAIMHSTTATTASSSDMVTNDLLNQIALDVVRTFPNGFAKIFLLFEVRMSLTRILYIWSSRNPHVSYFQGLNEIPAVFLIVFMHSFLRGNMNNVSGISAAKMMTIEADAYGCTEKILQKLYPSGKTWRFHSEVMLQYMEQIARVVDEPLCEHFRSVGVSFLHFGISWATCLLIREFPISHLVLIWDFLISCAPSSFCDYFICCCVAYLGHFSPKLMGMGLDKTMQLLQADPATRGHNNPDITTLIKQACSIHCDTTHLPSPFSPHHHPSPSSSSTDPQPHPPPTQLSNP